MNQGQDRGVREDLGAETEVHSGKAQEECRPCCGRERASWKVRLLVGLLHFSVPNQGLSSWSEVMELAASKQSEWSFEIEQVKE